MSKQKIDYDFVISQQTLDSIKEYQQDLISGNKKPGERLSEILQKNQKSVENLSTEEFIKYLVNTKDYKIFAESASTHNLWNPSEVHLLGDIVIRMPVKIFDDGAYKSQSPIKVYDSPLEGELLFAPGALLDDEIAGADSDVDELVKNGEIDQIAYNKFIERRLLPGFVEANNSAQAEGTTAEIHVPNLGGSSFAGNFEGQVGKYNNIAIQAMLEKHKDVLPNISYVRLATSDTQKESTKIGNINYEVRDSKGKDKDILPIFSLSTEGKQSQPPRKYFKIVAADAKSYPGNDFYENSRVTDEGMSAAATDCMTKIIGVEGEYLSKYNRYLPKNNDKKKWIEIARDHNVSLQVQKNIKVVSNDGKSFSLEEFEIKHPKTLTPKSIIIESNPKSIPNNPITISQRSTTNKNPVLELKFNSFAERERFISDMINKGNAHNQNLETMFLAAPDKVTLYIKPSDGNIGTYVARDGEIAVSFGKNNTEIANYFNQRTGLNQISSNNNNAVLTYNGAIYFDKNALSQSETIITSNPTKEPQTPTPPQPSLPPEEKRLSLTPQEVQMHDNWSKQFGFTIDPKTGYLLDKHNNRLAFKEQIKTDKENINWDNLEIIPARGVLSNIPISTNTTTTKPKTPQHPNNPITISQRSTTNKNPVLELKFNSSAERERFIKNMIKKGNYYNQNLQPMFLAASDPVTLYIKPSDGNIGTYVAKDGEIAVSFGNNNTEIADYFNERTGLNQISSSDPNNKKAVITANGAIYFNKNALSPSKTIITNNPTQEPKTKIAPTIQSQPTISKLPPQTPQQSSLPPTVLPQHPNNPITISQIYNPQINKTALALRFNSSAERERFIKNMIKKGNDHNQNLENMFFLDKSDQVTLYIKPSDGNIGTYVAKDGEIAVSFGKNNTEIADYFNERTGLNQISSSDPNNKKAVITANGAIYFNKNALSESKTIITSPPTQNPETKIALQPSLPPTVLQQHPNNPITISKIYNSQINKTALELKFNSSAERQSFINDMIKKGNDHNQNLENMFFLNKSNPVTLYIKPSDGNIGTYVAKNGETAVSFGNNKTQLADYFNQRTGLYQISSNNNNAVITANGAIYFNTNALSESKTIITSPPTQNPETKIAPTIPKHPPQTPPLQPSLPPTVLQQHPNNPITISKIYNSQINKTALELKFNSSAERQSFINDMIKKGNDHNQNLENMFFLNKSNPVTLYIKPSDGNIGTYVAKNGETAVSFGNNKTQLADYFNQRTGLYQISSNNNNAVITANGAIYFNTNALSESKTIITSPPTQNPETKTPPLQPSLTPEKKRPLTFEEQSLHLAWGRKYGMNVDQNGYLLDENYNLLAFEEQIKKDGENINWNNLEIAPTIQSTISKQNPQTPPLQPSLTPEKKRPLTLEEQSLHLIWSRKYGINVDQNGYLLDKKGNRLAFEEQIKKDKENINWDNLEIAPTIQPTIPKQNPKTPPQSLKNTVKKKILPEPSEGEEITQKQQPYNVVQSIRNFFSNRKKNSKIDSTSPIPQRVFGNIDRLRHEQWHKEFYIDIDDDGYLLNPKGGQRLALEEQLKRGFEKIDFNNIEITPAKQVPSNIPSNIPQRVFGNIDRLRHEQWHKEFYIDIDDDGYLLNPKGGQRLALEEQLKRGFEKIDFNNIEITPAKQVPSNIPSNIPQRVFGNIDRLRHEQWHNKLHIYIDDDGYLLNPKWGQRLALEEQLKRRLGKVDWDNIEITPSKQVQSIPPNNQQLQVNRRTTRERKANPRTTRSRWQ